MVSSLRPLCKLILYLIWTSGNIICFLQEIISIRSDFNTSQVI